MMVSIAQLQDIPPESMILLVGPPGAGKPDFCQQAILRRLAMDKPIIYVATDRGPSKVEAALREKGLREIEPGLLNFVDAYNETVGVLVPGRPDTLSADCSNLSSVGIAISKSQERMGKKDVLLVFDSLVSPYLLSGPEILRFLRLTLSKFVAEGNSVLACMDEGCGKQEDLGAMMSLSNGVVSMKIEDDKQLLTVVKHPKFEPARIEVATDKIWERKIYESRFWNEEWLRRFLSDFPQRMSETAAATAVAEPFKCNIFWPNFAFWSTMLWDPKRFPKIAYEAWKEFGTLTREMIPLLPWRMRIFFKFLLPKSFSKVKDAKKLLKFLKKAEKMRGDCITEYLEDISKTDEHYLGVYESRECCGFENVGASLASILPPMIAGNFKGFESFKGLERDWNAIETKCIGLGDPYCEWKVIPGEIDELKVSLEKDSSVVQRIHDRLMDRLTRFLLDGTPLVERPRLGNDFAMAHPDITLPAVAGERYRMALRMGGVRVGKKVGENLMDTGLGEDDAVKRFLTFLEHCKVGKVTLDETIMIEDNRESIWTKIYTMKREEPSCFFTTGFLNGFFSAVKNQHVKEIKCIGMGDPYCEWEFR